MSLPYIEAECGHTFDGNQYQVRCQTDALQVKLSWMELLDRKQVVWQGFPAGENSFDLTTVICPCRVRQIMINDQLINGEVQVVPGEDGYSSSTAFLAFSETWIGPFENSESM